jgi:hypothetical protein
LFGVTRWALAQCKISRALCIGGLWSLAAVNSNGQLVWQLVHGQSGGMPWIRIEEEIREIVKRHRVAFED